MLFTQCTFLQSMYHPTYSGYDSHFMTYVYQLLHVFGTSSCHEGVIVRQVKKQICQSKCCSSLKGHLQRGAERRLLCCLIYLCCNDSLRMASLCRNM